MTGAGAAVGAETGASAGPDDVEAAETTSTGGDDLDKPMGGNDALRSGEPLVALKQGDVDVDVEDDDDVDDDADNGGGDDDEEEEKGRARAEGDVAAKGGVLGGRGVLHAAQRCQRVGGQRSPCFFEPVDDDDAGCAAGAL